MCRHPPRSGEAGIYGNSARKSADAVQAGKDLGGRTGPSVMKLIGAGDDAMCSVGENSGEPGSALHGTSAAPKQHTAQALHFVPA